jgi:hypothetical protein
MEGREGERERERERKIILSGVRVNVKEGKE